MNFNVSRRHFLKSSFYGAVGVLALPTTFFPDQDEHSLGRVAGSFINVYSEASGKGEVVTRKKRDELVHLYYEVTSEKGINRRWFRVWEGYVHSAYIQPVEIRNNEIPGQITPPGRPAQVTVPYTQSFLLDKQSNWKPGYRLYFGSVHWVTDLEEGPDGEAWYKISDSYLRVYYAPAAHLHLYSAAELAPISEDVPAKDKSIEVSIREQAVSCYEGSQMVRKMKVSTGVPQQGEVPPGEVPTDTPIGTFHITVKTPSRHMGGTELTHDIETSALPGVPWVSFFHKDGYSFHGTYWHSNFGLRMSHGCVNMRNEDALWIYRWSSPQVKAGERQVSEWGTRVTVIE